jgi:hypothetical protein
VSPLFVLREIGGHPGVPMMMGDIPHAPEPPKPTKRDERKGAVRTANGLTFYDKHQELRQDIAELKENQEAKPPPPPPLHIEFGPQTSALFNHLKPKEDPPFASRGFSPKRILEAIKGLHEFVQALIGLGVLILVGAALYYGVAVPFIFPHFNK